MTTTYRLLVHVDEHWVQYFKDANMHLCTAFGVKSNLSNQEYNIIATSEGLDILLHTNYWANLIFANS